ncbi:MAG: HAMP domain-containing sensor histidine kinase [Gemmatimonadota bacterium]
MSRAFHLRRPAPTSTTMLAVFLLAIVVLACALAVQAYATARSHQATTEAVLSDYAGIAAAEYGRVAREHLSRVFDVAFDEIPRRYRPGRMPDPVEVRWDLDDAARAIRCPCPGLQDPSLVFRTDLRDGRSSFEGALAAADGEAVTAFVRSRLASTPAERYELATLGAESGAGDAVVLWATVFDEQDVPVMAYGVVIDRRALTELAEHWYERHALLPEAITRGEDEAGLVRVELHGADSGLLFASHEDSRMGMVAADTLDRYLGGVVVEASIRPDAADRLVIGGLPSSRLPFSLALLGLTLAVGAAGLWEVRKHQQLARLREDFISSVSHELRTPLTQIRMLAELQADRKLRTDEERERANRIMARESQRLTQLVENILHFSRSRAVPRSPSPLQPVVLQECVSDVAEAFRPLMDRDAGTLETDIPGGLAVMGHRDALRQVLSNLLDNALKYGPPGQTVRIGATAGTGVVRIVVDDEGPGVPEQDRSAIWEPYMRLPRDVDGHKPGSGVGLAVVKTLVGELEGRVWIDDAPGGGARFIMELEAAPEVSMGPERPPTKPTHDPQESPPVGAHTAG